MLAGILNQSAKAQYFTVRVAGGYAWPGLIKSEGITGPVIDARHPERDALGPMANIIANDSTKSVSPIRGSYGQGMNFTLGLGYMINPYIGVELGVSYLKSVTMTCHQRHEILINSGTLDYGPWQAFGYYLNVDMATNAYGLSLMPAIIINGAKPGWKVYPYGRIGVSMPIFGGQKTTIDIKPDDNLSTDAPSLFDKISAAPYFLGHETKATLKTEGTVSLGVNGAIGIAYKPFPLLTVTAELNGQYLVTRAKSAKITQWDADGVSKLNDRGIYRTQFNFVDKIDESSNNGDYNHSTNGVSKYDPTKPKDDLRPTGPFSNIGFNIGVCLNLSKEILKSFKEKKKKSAK